MRLSPGLVRNIAASFNDLGVDRTAYWYKMKNLVTICRAFRSIPCAFYAVDVTFQQADRLLGSIDKDKPYYFEKHKVCG